MARTPVVYDFKSIALVSSASKTLALITAPANQSIEISGLRVGLNGTITTDPTILFQILIASAVGATASGGSTMIAPQLLDTRQSLTPRSTYTAGPTSGSWFTEPTYNINNSLYNQRVHPQGNLAEEFFDRPIILDAGKSLVLVAFQGGGASNSADGVLYGWE